MRIKKKKTPLVSPVFRDYLNKHRDMIAQETRRHGGLNAVADKLGVAHTTVRRYMQEEGIPFYSQLSVEVRDGGRNPRWKRKAPHQYITRKTPLRKAADIAHAEKLADVRRANAAKARKALAEKRAAKLPKPTSAYEASRRKKAKRITRQAVEQVAAANEMAVGASIMVETMLALAARIENLTAMIDGATSIIEARLPEKIGGGANGALTTDTGEVVNNDDTPHWLRRGADADVPVPPRV